MKSINKLEAVVAKWYEKVPHLPSAGRKWLSDNVWWLALISVVLMVFAIFGLFSLLFFSGAFLIGFAGPIGAVVGGALWIAGLLGVFFLLLQLIVTSTAITPLKKMQKRGWSLLFLVALLNVAAELVSFLLKLNVFDLVWSLLMTAVGVYFLFEIRSSFVSASAKKPVEAKVVTKKA